MVISKKIPQATKGYHTVFWSTIPLVPDTILGWTTSDYASAAICKKWTPEMKKNPKEYPPLFLQNVYALGFIKASDLSQPLRGNDYDEAISTISGALSGGRMLNPLKTWTFNHHVFTPTASECRYAVVPPLKYGRTVPSNEFLDLYDMASNVHYGRDENGSLFRMENGKKVTVDMVANPFVGDCLGNKQDCDNPANQVAQCLLSGNPGALAHCLDNLKDANMFDVAQSEVNKLHPLVLAKLLATFGFKLKKYTDGLTKPIEFDEWENKVLATTVTDEVAKQIKANTKLMSYLKAVVSIVRQNPILLECNKQLKADNTYAAKAKIETFIQPVFTSPRGRSLFEESVLLSTPAMPFGMSMPLAAQLQNVMGMSMSRLPFMGMVGGGPSECVNADLLRKTFNSLFSRMERSGKVLVDEDKAKVENTINQVATLERQLNRFMDDIKLYTKLSETYSLSNPVPVERIRDVDIATRAAEKRSDVSKTLASLTDASNKNIKDLVNSINILVTTILPALNSVVLGIHTPLLTRASP